MDPKAAQTKTLSVYCGTDFTVSNGANLGDGLSFAEDMMLDDIYRLTPYTEAARLSLVPEGENFRVAEGSELGCAGAPVCLDCALTLMTPDGETTDALVMVELDAHTHVSASYLVPLSVIQHRIDYALVGINTDTAREKLAQVGCVSFTRGTRITMASGAQVPIEDLSVGDRVLTRYSGVQQIRWIGQSTTRAVGNFAPVRIRAGVLNNEHDLIVSPEHRLFIYQREDKIGAGRAELLVKACHLVNGDTVTVMQGGYVDYFQLLFDDHQIIYAEGIAAESFMIDAHTAPAVPAELSDKMTPARWQDDLKGTRNMPGIDVSENLLDRPDAPDILRRASTR